MYLVLELSTTATQWFEELSYEITEDESTFGCLLQWLYIILKNRNIVQYSQNKKDLRTIRMNVLYFKIVELVAFTTSKKEPQLEIKSPISTFIRE